MSRRAKSKSATVLRRQQTSQPESDIVSSSADIRAVFRKYFEQKYNPLEDSESEKEEKQRDVPASGEESGAPDWEGFENEDSVREVNVVDNTVRSGRPNEIRVEEAYRDFMSPKPPTLAKKSTAAKTPAQQKDGDEEESAEAANLKNDLALQRLLKESHLIKPTQATGPVGAQRHQAVEMRLQSLGSKSSILEQTKMPLSHRRGINAKTTALETRRRIEAKENGIILERPTQVLKTKPMRRDRGVDAPTIGKFSGGTLKLSRKDLQDIQGSRGGRRSGNRR